MKISVKQQTDIHYQKNISAYNAIVHRDWYTPVNSTLLIHIALSSNADACYSLNGQLPDDLQWGWWEWGNNLMYHKCLQVARWKVGVRSSVVGGRFSLTSAQLLTCGRLSLFLYIFHFFVHRFPSISMEENLQKYLCPGHLNSNEMIDKEWTSLPIYILSSTLLPCRGREMCSLEKLNK